MTPSRSRNTAAVTTPTPTSRAPWPAPGGRPAGARRPPAKPRCAGVSRSAGAGTTTTASASVAVTPSALPTTPQTNAPTDRASSTAAHDVDRDLRRARAAADAEHEQRVTGAQARAAQPGVEHGLEALVVGARRQLGDVVHRRVGLEARELAEVAHRVRGVPGPAAHADHEQPPASGAAGGEPHRHGLDRVHVDRARDSRGLLQERLRVGLGHDPAGGYPCRRLRATSAVLARPSCRRPNGRGRSSMSTTERLQAVAVPAGDPARPPLVSVVIPCLNEAENIDRVRLPGPRRRWPRTTSPARSSSPTTAPTTAAPELADRGRRARHPRAAPRLRLAPTWPASPPPAASTSSWPTPT